MLRKRLVWKPQWEGAVKGYAVKFCVKNAWRVPSMELEDLIQYSWLAYHECVERYPSVGSPQHFMSLFKRVLFSRIMTLAAEGLRRKRVWGEVSEEDPVVEIPAEDCAAKVEWGILLSEAPPEVHEILRKLVAGTLEVGYARHPNGTRETRSQMVARLAGVREDAGQQLLERLREVLSGAPVR